MMTMHKNKYFYLLTAWLGAVGVAWAISGLNPPEKILPSTSSGRVGLVSARLLDGGKPSRIANVRYVPIQDSDDELPKSNVPTNNRPGVLLRIPLPVDSAAAAEVKRSLKRIVETAPPGVRAEDRLIVVLEFETSRGKTGRGSELEACQSLARYLGSPDMNRIDTIAYIPTASVGDPSPTQLSGHAVLIAIAANQIAMEKNVSIGAAGIDEANIDDLVRGVYRGIASQRLRLPVPVVMAMLDKDQKLFRVQTDQGIEFVDGDTLKKLEAEGKAIETTTLSEQGLPAVLTSQQLADFRLLSLFVESKNELESRLDLAAHSLDSSPAFSGSWRAAQVNLPAFVNDRTTQWIRRSLSSQFSSNKPPNLIIFDIDGNTGDLDACLALARYLVDLDDETVQSVAYVHGSVRGPVALVILACDQLIMASETRLGGHELGAIGDEEQVAANDPANAVPPDELADLKPMIQALARDKSQDWSLMMAMLDPNLPVSRFRHRETGQLRLLSSEELASLDKPNDWNLIGPVDVTDGLTAGDAERMYVARTVADDFDQVQAFYQLGEPPQVLQPTATDRYVEAFAGFLSRPDISFLLLFGAVFLLSTEMSAPGISIPGFLSALCFMLFFWSHYLEGSAHWLEILMFLVGIAFIAIEIFALPGIGIFGIGGLILIVTSLVLASQNFLLPQTSEQLAKLPQSLLPLVGAGLGFFTAIYALRKVLPNSPYLRNMMLAPRSARLDTGLDTNIDPEAMVDWSHLAGANGEAITRLVPSGKARISGRVYDVITDGRMIDKGQRVEVIEAVGNRVVVRPRDE